MPTLNISESGFLTSLFAGFDSVFDGEVVVDTPGSAVIEDANGDQVVFSSDANTFSYFPFNGEIFLIAGFINDAHFLSNDSLIATMELDIDISVLTPALEAELNGSNTAAFEELFLPMGWTVNGSNGKDILLPGATSDDGVSLNLSGRDVVKLEGGADKFFAGDNLDFVWGGDGNDKLWGGSGNDRLYGDSGNDKLLGQNGNDRMWGGSGNDDLKGGNGQDTIKGDNGADIIDGQRGDDTLTGGNGSDTFVFLGFSYGADTITDFDMANDFVTGAITNINATVETVSGGAMVRASGGSVTFEGLSVEDVQTFLPDAFDITPLT